MTRSDRRPGPTARGWSQSVTTTLWPCEMPTGRLALDHPRESGVPSGARSTPPLADPWPSSGEPRPAAIWEDRLPGERRSCVDRPAGGHHAGGHHAGNHHAGNHHAGGHHAGGHHAGRHLTGRSLAADPSLCPTSPCPTSPCPTTRRPSAHGGPIHPFFHGHHPSGAGAWRRERLHRRPTCPDRHPTGPFLGPSAVTSTGIWIGTCAVMASGSTDSVDRFDRHLPRELLKREEGRLRVDPLSHVDVRR